MPTKWYVNLVGPSNIDPPFTGINYGSTVWLSAKRGAISTYNDRKNGVTRTADWTIAASRGAAPHLRASTDDENGYFTNHFNALGEGGITYTVTCTKRGGRQKLNQQIETWRRVYYTVHTMGSRCKGIYDAIKGRLNAAFAPAFIELKEAHQLSTLVNEEVTLSTQVEPLHDDEPPRDPEPHLRILFVKDLASESETEIVFPMDDAGFEKRGFKAKLIDTNPLGREVVLDLPERMSISSAPGFFVSGDVTLDDDSTEPIPGAQVTRVDAHQIKILLTGGRLVEVSDALSDGWDHRFRVKVRVAGSIAGVHKKTLGTRQHEYICINTKAFGPEDSVARIRNRCLFALVHEIGHAFGQVDATSPKVYNEAYGGVGNHCSENSKTVNSYATKGYTWTTSGSTREWNGNGNLCVMFHAANVENMGDGKFCQTCTDFLQRKLLREV